MVVNSSNTVSLRTLTNNPSAPAFSGSSPTYTIYAEDWTTLKSSIQSGSLGIKTAHVSVTETSTSNDGIYNAGKSTLVGNVAVGGTLGVTGSATFSAASVFSLGLTISAGGATITAGDLTLTAGNQIITAGNLTLTAGNIIMSGSPGTVDGVNIAAHTHDGTAAGGPLIPAGSFATGSITYADIDPDEITAGGEALSSGTLADTVIVSNTRTSVNSMANGVIYIPANAFTGSDEGTTTIYSLADGAGDLDLVGVITNGVVGIRFRAADTDTDMATTSIVVPANADAAGSSLTVTAYVVIDTTIEAGEEIVIELNLSAFTPASDTVSQNLFTSSAVSTETAFDENNTALLIYTATAEITATNYAAGDILSIGIRRVTPSVDTDANTENAIVLGTKVQFVPLYA